MSRWGQPEVEPLELGLEGGLSCPFWRGAPKAKSYVVSEGGCRAGIPKQRVNPEVEADPSERSDPTGPQGVCTPLPISLATASAPTPIAQAAWSGQRYKRPSLGTAVLACALWGAGCTEPWRGNFSGCAYPVHVLSPGCTEPWRGTPSGCACTAGWPGIDGASPVVESSLPTRPFLGVAQILGNFLALPGRFPCCRADPGRDGETVGPPLGRLQIRQPRQPAMAEGADWEIALAST